MGVIAINSLALLRWLCSPQRAGVFAVVALALPHCAGIIVIIALASLPSHGCHCQPFAGVVAVIAQTIFPTSC
jgi:hypothetical protein